MFNLRFFAGSLFNLAVLSTLYKIIPFFFFPPLLLLTVIMLLYPLGALAYRKYRNSRITENTLGVAVWFSFIGFLLFMKMLQLLPPLYVSYSIGVRFCVSWAILITTLTPVLLLAGAFEYALLENMAIRKKGYDFVLPYILFLSATLLAFIASVYLPIYFGLSALFVLILLTLPFYIGFSKRFRLITVILSVILSIIVPSIVDEETLIDVISKYNQQPMKENKRITQPVLWESIAQKNSSVRIFSHWGRLGYFRVSGNSDKSELSGSYYGRKVWTVKPEAFNYQPLDRAIFSMLSDPDGKVAIIGSGGGRQVAFASSAGLLNIHAVDIEKSLPDAMKLAEKLGYHNPYKAKGVRFFNMDGRKFIENAPDGSFSMIMIADAGSYPSMISTMLSSHGMLHTRDAYSTYRQKLNKNGFLVFWCWKAFPNYSHMIQQFLETMRAVGMNAASFENDSEFMVIDSSDLSQQQIEKHVLSFQKMFRLHKSDDTSHIKVRVATDQSLHSGLSYIVGYELSQKIIYGLSAFLLSLSFSVIAVFSLMAKKGRKTAMLFRSSLSLLVGLNYILLQVAVMYEITRETYDIYLGAVGGAMAFLTCYLLGTILYYSLGQRNVFSMFILLLIAAFSCLAWGYSLAFILILSTASSIFFPVLFEFCESMRTQIFVMDAIGSVTGAFFGFGITYLWGVGVYNLVIAGLVITLLMIAVPVLNGLRKGNDPCS